MRMYSAEPRELERGTRLTFQSGHQKDNFGKKSKKGSLIPLKLIIIMGVISILVYLLNKFPEITIIIVGISIVLIIGYWLFDMVNNQDRS